MGGQRHAPAALLPGETRYLLHRKLGGPQGRSGRVRKISPPPPSGFDRRTVYPEASRYTDWAIPAHDHFCIIGGIVYSTDISKCKITNWKERSKTRADWEKSIMEGKVRVGL